ncbi:MAG: single-stranded DNA-binding protein [Actinomycetota bacterium]
MNTITLVGRLASDPRLEPSAGNPICTFRLAVDRGRTEGADFIPIKTFGTPAEQHHRYLAKGRLISITGRLSHSQWTDKDTGDNRERYEVIANQVGYLDAPTKDEPTEVKPGEEAF